MGASAAGRTPARSCRYFPRLRPTPTSPQETARDPTQRPNGRGASEHRLRLSGRGLVIANRGIQFLGVVLQAINLFDRRFARRLVNRLVLLE